MAKIDWMGVEDIKKAEKDGVTGAEEAFKRGIDNPRRNPIEAAVAAINKGIWEKNFREGVAKWVKKMQSITIEQWRAAALAAASTYADRAGGVGSEHWGAYYENGKSTIEAATAKFLASSKGKSDMQTFWADLHKLKEVV